ncbi:MAG: hypothetical protein KatS3mg015_0533 [Fimbriimonadales bacterium]|jgi:hypothetical protein|nr:MAG: hypothetical protein KatS3mg015_0533 [Fimbriimonadales bacterium]
MRDPNSLPNDYEEQIHAAVDGEVQPEDWERLKGQIESDPVAQRLYFDLVALKEATRKSKSLHPEKHEAVLAACMDRIAEIERVEKTDALIGRMRYALTAAVACLLVVVGYYNWSHPNQSAQNSMLPLRAAATGAVEARSVNTAVEWLSRTLGLNVQPPPAKPILRPIRAEVARLPDCNLGRLILLDTDGSLYTYVISDRPLFQEGETVGDNRLRCIRQGNLNILYWTDGRFYYGLAGQCDPEVLVELVE